MFNKISFNTLIPCGTTHMISGAPKFFGIVSFWASACLGGMYGDNKCLVLKSLSSLGTSDVVGGVISFAFYFLLPVRYPHVVSEGPDRSTIDFMDVLTGWTRTFSTTRGAYCIGGTYPIVSSMIGVGDVVTASDSTTKLALDIEKTML